MPEELDELNRLFTSKNAEDVIKFYDHFDNAEQLIQWMKNRPSAPMKIYEVEGEKDIVIVIPTANHDGEYARNCANEIFKGQQIVFVESNGPFFNYAKSCNFGLKYALKYNPKWVVLSNDDVKKADDMSKLKSELVKSDHKNTDIVLLKNSESRPYDLSSVLVYETPVLRAYRKFAGSEMRVYQKLRDKFTLNLDVIGKRRFDKFSSKFLYNKLKEFYGFFDFIIINGGYLKTKLNFFDPNFVNGYEDHFLSYEFSEQHRHISIIDFEISSVWGYTLGSGYMRRLKEIVPLIYFNYLLKNEERKL
jgi:hypothetical protein